jgi:beta-glucosidase
MRFYSKTLFSHLGDRVKKWVTINEPMVFATNGYIIGEMPPGKRNDLRGMFHTTHYLLLCHSEMVRAFRETVKDGKIGIAEAQIWIKPLRPDKDRDVRVAEFMDHVVNRSFIDPIMRGVYPALVAEKLERYLPSDFSKDLDRMKEPFDFVGINYYMSKTYKYSFFMPLTKAREVSTPGARRSAMWEIYPGGLYQLLLRLKNEYGNPPCYITENGYPLPEDNGPVTEDNERIEYLREHIDTAAGALNDGVNLKGYYHWSLMDNFEWAHGYHMRFGLLRTDFTTLERTWKQSAHWYKKVIENNGTV